MMDFIAREAISPKLAEALERYWDAKTPEDERRAYRDAVAHGQPPSYGEDWARAEPIRIEWGRSLPGAPISAVIEGEFPTTTRLLVEFDDG